VLFVGLKVQLTPKDDILVRRGAILGAIVEFAQPMELQKVHSQRLIARVVLFVAIVVTKVTKVVLFAIVSIQLVSVEQTRVTMFTQRMASF
jgi:hypothetical protein